MSDFVHLHLHSDYSLLDGANRIEDVVRKAAEYGMPAVALTDHGNLFGAVQFHDKALEHGVRPIIGCEVYVARNGRKLKEGRSSQSNHLVLLAADETGYRNLVRLVSLGYLEGFYYRPRVDKELLSQHSEGLICLSACLQGSVAQALTGDRYEEARQEAADLLDIFGRERFYLEVQDHDLDDQKKANEGILRLAREMNLPLVATNDCHYLNQDDHYAHEVLMCIQTGKTIDDPDRLVYQSREFFFKSAEEMKQRFDHYPEALRNTLRIADMCRFQLGETCNVFPDFQVPDGETVDTYFEKVVQQGFAERRQVLLELQREGRLLHPLSDYEQRLQREIGIICQMNFPAYFLIVWDFIRHAREQGIPVGPGRGSAAGSLVSYAMRITDVDPLQYDLLFERFLNPERVTPPDIDIDFCMLRRGEVIDYVTQRYGRDNVSHIISFGTMAARGAIRDVGRGLNIPFAEVDQIAKLVPQEPGATLHKAVKQVRELREMAEKNPKYQDLISVARKLEGLSRHASTHAAGVVIAPRPLIDLIPLYKSNRDEITTQYAMSDLERLGLLKMDFLGLTTLTVIQQALEQIRDQTGEQIDLEKIALDDSKTLELFCEGRTNGIFQFESAGMRDILRRLQPSRFEDLVALNALYRPGPIQGGMIDDFIDRRHARVQVTYQLPELEEILRETYGVIVYQEQVMQIASKLAGFSLGGADVLRSAMGKKKKAEMARQRKKFLAGAKQRGIPAATARGIFDLMEQFGGYGFNKSHSAAYALLAYQTGFLKAHFPVQFMASLLTHEMSNTDKVVQYLSECREMGIDVLPPDVNTGGVSFQGLPDRRIRFGLAAIKNVGESAIQVILKARKDSGPFRDPYDFCERVDLRVVNKRVLESLLKAGALDALGSKRKSMWSSLDRVLEHGARAQRDRISGQRGLFAEPAADDETQPLPDVGEWPDREKWRYEKETLGFYLTGHPLQKFRAELEGFSEFNSRMLNEDLAGREVSVGGVVASVKKIQTRKGDSMAGIQLEDLEGTVEVLLWPRVYEKCRELLDSDSPVLVRGKCDVDARGDVKILCREMIPLASVWKEGVERARIRIPVPRIQDDRMRELKSLIQKFSGACPVEFELVQEHSYRLRVIPAEPVSVDPIPSFVSQVNQLFGDNACVLEPSRSAAKALA